MAGMRFDHSKDRRAVVTIKTTCSDIKNVVFDLQSVFMHLV